MAVAALMILTLACGESQRQKPLSEAGERLYTLRGNIEAIVPMCDTISRLPRVTGVVSARRRASFFHPA